MMTTDRQLLTLWRVSCGQLCRRNPVEVIDLGSGMIKVPGTALIQQPRIDRHESFHDSRIDAVKHILAEAQRDVNRANILAEAQRDVNRAKAELTNATRRLRSAQLRFQNEVVAAGR